MPKLNPDFLKLLEHDSVKAVEHDDEQEMALVASVAISLRRIADNLTRIRVVMERPRR
jgi:hypothetical protein